jgi:hypothetical protein
MKSLQKLLAVTSLMFILTCSAFAGEMGTGFTSPPPPSSSVVGEMGTGSAATAETTMTGEMITGASVTVDPIHEIALNILQSLLALF